MLWFFLSRSAILPHAALPAYGEAGSRSAAIYSTGLGAKSGAAAFSRAAAGSSMVPLLVHTRPPHPLRVTGPPHRISYVRIVPAAAMAAVIDAQPQGVMSVSLNLSYLLVNFESALFRAVSHDEALIFAIGTVNVLHVVISSQPQGPMSVPCVMMGLSSATGNVNVLHIAPSPVCHARGALERKQVNSPSGTPSRSQVIKGGTLGSQSFMVLPCVSDSLGPECRMLRTHSAHP